MFSVTLKGENNYFCKAFHNVDSFTGPFRVVVAGGLGRLTSQQENINRGLRTADCGLRTADCGLIGLGGYKTRAKNYGLGQKHGIEIKHYGL